MVTRREALTAGLVAGTSVILGESTLQSANANAIVEKEETNKPETQRDEVFEVVVGSKTVWGGGYGYGTYLIIAKNVFEALEKFKKQNVLEEKYWNCINGIKLVSSSKVIA